MYKRQRQGWLKHLDFIALDLVCLLASFILSDFIRHGSVKLFDSNRVYLTVGIAMLVFDFLIIVLLDMMNDVVKRGYFKEFAAILQQDLLVFAALTVFLFSVKDSEQLSRIVLWLTLLFHILFGYTVRILWKRKLMKGGAFAVRRAMLLVSDGANVREVLERFRENPEDEIQVTGIVIADGETAETEIEGIPVVCSLEEAPKYICHEWIDEVYLSTSATPIDFIELCMEMGVTIHRELNRAGSDRQFVERIAGVHVLTNSMNSATPVQMFIKRLMDIVGGLVGSLAALIVIALVGPRIKKASPGPVLFKQERIGQNGKHFIMPKIRSMYMDAEARKQELMKDNRIADGMMFKLDFDPRIIGNEILPDGTRKTGIGEFIRSTSLDEFPQFFCVLKGQMSLVGTRPPTLDEWEKYEYHHRARLATKPGITGMWQVNGRSKVTDFEEVVRLDTEYINNWSLGLDFKILLKTVVNVLKQDGAM